MVDKFNTLICANRTRLDEIESALAKEFKKNKYAIPLSVVEERKKLKHEIVCAKMEAQKQGIKVLKRTNKPLPKTITVAKYPNHEMAFILVDGESVFTGNYWDFHSGCHGTEIGGYDLSGSWDKGIDSLATALKSKMQEQGLCVELVQKQLTDQEYKKLGF